MSVKARGVLRSLDERRKPGDNRCLVDKIYGEFCWLNPAARDEAIRRSMIGLAAENEAVKRTKVVMTRLKIIL